MLFSTQSQSEAYFRTLAEQTVSIILTGPGSLERSSCCQSLLSGFIRMGRVVLQEDFLPCSSAEIVPLCNCLIRILQECYQAGLSGFKFWILLPERRVRIVTVLGPPAGLQELPSTSCCSQKHSCFIARLHPDDSQFSACGSGLISPQSSLLHIYLLLCFW